MGTRRIPNVSAKVAAKRVLSWHTRRGLIIVLVACMVALVASSVSFGVGARIPVAHAAACTEYWRQLFFNTAWYEIDGDSSCFGVAPHGFGDVYNCWGVNVTMNMDVWLSTGTAPGSPRLADSGRTGLETWASDCTWHTPAEVVGWGQTFTAPLWACMWVYDATFNNSFDWFCAQDY